MQLINSLTKEERLQVPRLLGHDLINEITILRSSLCASQVKGVKCEPRAGGLVGHIGYTTQAVNILSCINKMYTHPGFEFEDITGVFEDKVKINCVHARELNTIGPLSYSIIFNLVKNAIRSHEAGEIEDPVVLFSQFTGFPEKAIYVPDGAADFKRFMEFGVYDFGSGFPNDKPLVNYIDREPPKPREDGFGLYYTGLVAKVLKSPIDIVSKPGETIVSFYHPIYE